MIDAEQPNPALLAEGQGDATTELDELLLGEVGVQTCPQSVEVLAAPGDGLGVRERSLLPVVVQVGGLEVEEFVVLLFPKSRRGGLLGALVAAELALDGPGDVHPAQVLDRMFDDAAVELGLPTVGEGPKRLG